MIMNLSAFLRSTLTIDPEHSVGLDEEIALQRLYLDIEQARFPDRLQVDVDIPQNLENACVPVLILQPIIENAIKYGVAPSKGKIGIRLSASHEYGLLVLRVENDVRSEEHTSELPSLMRISYAVFCLKKKHIHERRVDPI